MSISLPGKKQRCIVYSTDGCCGLYSAAQFYDTLTLDLWTYMKANTTADKNRTGGVSEKTLRNWGNVTGIPIYNMNSESDVDKLFLDDISPRGAVFYSVETNALGEGSGHIWCIPPKNKDYLIKYNDTFLLLCHPEHPIHQNAN